jgi:hypothetical protein
MHHYGVFRRLLGCGAGEVGEMTRWGEINCPRCEELEGKLAQQDDLVQAAVERGFWLGRSCGGSKAEIDAALAAIRAGNNVLCVSCGAPTPNDFCNFCLEEE